MIENSQKLNTIENKWRSLANTLSSELDSIEKEKETSEKKLRNINKSIDTSILSEISALDRAPKLETYKQFTELLGSVHSSLEKDSEFTNNLNFVDQYQTSKIYE